MRWLTLTLAILFCAAEVPAAEAIVAVDQTASHIDISVKATVDSFVGKLATYTPSVTIDRVTGAILAARLSFHFDAVKTGNEKRDREMHVWQDTAKFPEGEFILTSLGAPAGGKLIVLGRLTLHGVTHDLSFPVTVAREGAALTVEGEASVDTRWFGLPIIRKFAVLKVDPVVVVRFQLVGAVPPP